MNNEKRCKVVIFGDEYALVASESAEHVAQAARLVDSLMQEIARTSGIGTANDKKVAVLAALRIASLLLSAEHEQAKEQKERTDIIDRIDCALREISS